MPESYFLFAYILYTLQLLAFYCKWRISMGHLVTFSMLPQKGCSLAADQRDKGAYKRRATSVAWLMNVWVSEMFLLLRTNPESYKDIKQDEWCVSQHHAYYIHKVFVVDVGCVCDQIARAMATFVVTHIFGTRVYSTLLFRNIYIQCVVL